METLCRTGDVRRIAAGLRWDRCAGRLHDFRALVDWRGAVQCEDLTMGVLYPLEFDAAQAKGCDWFDCSAARTFPNLSDMPDCFSPFRIATPNGSRGCDLPEGARVAISGIPTCKTFYLRPQSPCTLWILQQYWYPSQCALCDWPSHYVGRCISPERWIV